MELPKTVFKYSDYRTLLNDVMRNAPRGLQSRMARAIRCQATYLIRVLKQKASFTDDQAFLCGKFLKLSGPELDYFLDLVRMDRAASAEAKEHFRESLEKKAKAASEVKNRVPAAALETSFENQLRYYSTSLPSSLHLATSCPQFQTIKALAQRFRLGEEKVHEVLAFLSAQELVTFDEKRKTYTHNGKSIHLPKDSPIHASFQKTRREAVLRRLEGERGTNDLSFSSAFATSLEHQAKIKAELLKVIEKSHRELAQTASEETFFLVVDLLPI